MSFFARCDTIVLKIRFGFFTKKSKDKPILTHIYLIYIYIYTRIYLYVRTYIYVYLYIYICMKYTVYVYM